MPINTQRPRDGQPFAELLVFKQTIPLPSPAPAPVTVRRSKPPKAAPPESFIDRLLDSFRGQSLDDLILEAAESGDDEWAGLLAAIQTDLENEL